VAVYRKGQDKGRGVYSGDFEESKVTGLSRDAYNPGPTPNVYVENAQGKNRIDVSKVDDQYKHPDGTDPKWHVEGGFSGPVQRTGGKGFAADGGPANNHPSKGTDRYASRGTDSSTSDQGSVSGTKFKWQ
jgi:hypothetical protein